ncbi:MAG: hypothetical protein AAGG38_02735 [Planctomycetota bacterium]
MPDDLNPPRAEVTPPAALPTYAALVRRYNENAGALDALWARTKVEVRWRDEKNRKRRESGDGRLIFERPLNTAWTVEVLGDPKLWAGSDVRGFWLFDRLGEGRAYYGAYGRRLYRPLPLPIQPEALPYLLGLVPLDAGRRPEPPEVEWFNGYYLIEPPGLDLRLMLDPATARPVRVDLTDSEGQSVVTCILTGDLEVSTMGDDERRAVLPKKAELYPRDQESRLTVTLVRASGDDQKIKNKWFDYELLKKALRPKVVIDLNEP